MINHDHERTRQLRDHLKKRILVLDGAMGTSLQKFNLQARDFGGEAQEGCNEILVLTKPEIITNVHEQYLEAGCDIIETNTFGGTPLVLGEYGLADRATELNIAATKLAVASARRYSTPDRPRFVAGSIGPTTKALSVTGGATYDELRDNFLIQARALLTGGVDYFLVETCQDTRNIKAALDALDQLYREVGYSIPIAVSATIEASGTMLAGQNAEALAVSLAHRDLLYLGLNCATGPEAMIGHLRDLARISPSPVSCLPNAGLPNENGVYSESPAKVAAVLADYAKKGWLNIVGGCCGTTPAHIAEIAKTVGSLPPRAIHTERASYLSGVDILEITDNARPVIVGERTNVIGSKKFKTLITEGQLDEAADIAKAQIKNGAQIIDICLSNPDRDELSDMRRFLDVAAKRIRVPLMIDSLDERVIAMALTYSQGKAIINSINLENGEERFARVLPLARQYGAGIVVGTIDDDPEQGMALTRERKLAVAEREYELLTRKYGIKPEDIYWDPLTFPAGVGDKKMRGTARETIEALRLLKQRFPGTKSVLGVSNVSFGLPAAGREVLNSVFLYHAVQAGLDLAIVNAEKLVRYASIQKEELKLAEDVLFIADDDAITLFANHFRNKTVTANVRSDSKALTPEEKLSRAIIEGSKDGLIEALDATLVNLSPLEIINGPLMKGMDEVGKLFNANQLIVAEVLQSAEVMKAAVTHLQPKLAGKTMAGRGRMVIATVKGDVHDIGKNLVYMILANNGFEVIDAGIKVTSEQLLEFVRKHNPDMIGLSGLLVKSAHQMAATAEDLRRAGVSVPLLLGGAALSEAFVRRFVAPAYDNDNGDGIALYITDAMQSLEVAKKICDPEKFAELKKEVAAKKTTPATEQKQGFTQNKPVTKSINRIPASELPQPPDFARHILFDTPLTEIWKFINPKMLYNKHLGHSGSVVKLVEALKEEYSAKPEMAPSAVYKFFPAASDGNDILLFKEGAIGTDKPIGRFHFKRQTEEQGLCLSDFVTPLSSLPAQGQVKDSIGLFVVSVGQDLRSHVERLTASGEYLKAHALQALAIQSAEAYAEYLHASMRKSWGFSDKPELTMMERFQAKYRGRRYSFGYAACPELEQQAELFRLLQADEIGVKLTDGFMMDPEASISALVFHHPDAINFSVERSN